MLGMGCPWKGMCKFCKSASNYHKKDYCNNDSRWESCPHRPINDGNKKVQRNYDHRKGTHDTVSLGQVIMFIVLAMVLISGLMKLGIIGG